MPEGSECHRIAMQLNNKIAGQTFKGIEVLSGRYTIHNLPEGMMDFSVNLPIEISEVSCKGKFIYWKTKNYDWSIWNTLGMTGSWSDKIQKHSRVLFLFGADNPIYFNDIRNFGTLKFVNSEEELKAKLNSLGPDMLKEVISDSDFSNRFKKHGAKTLPEVLMNQKIISGVGNYVKAESLYLSGLSPHRTWNSLSQDEVSKLKKSIQTVLRNSFENGGATIKTYQDFEGKIGNYSNKFLIYNQSEDPNGFKVIKEETKDKRVTHWVPDRQK